MPSIDSILATGTCVGVPHQSARNRLVFFLIYGGCREGAERHHRQRPERIGARDKLKFLQLFRGAVDRLFWQFMLLRSSQMTV